MLFRSAQHGKTIHAVAFDPTGRTVASGCDDGYLRCFAAATGKAVSEVRGQGAVLAACYAADGDTVFLGTDDGVWRAMVASGEVLERRPCPAGVTSLLLSPDGHTLLAGCRNGSVQLWRLHDVDPAPLTVRVGANPVGALALDSDGRLIASGDAAGVLCLVDARNGTVIAKLENAHGAPIHGVGFVGTGQAQRLFSAGADAHLKVWIAPWQADHRQTGAGGFERTRTGK